VTAVSTPAPLRIAVVGTADGWSTERLLDAVEAETGYRRLVEMHEVVLELGTGALRHGTLDLRELDGLIVKKIARRYSPAALDRVELLRYLEGQGVRVFSRPGAMYTLIDRLSGTVALQLAGIPMPETVVTESLELARAAVARMGAVVAKPLYTSKARGMVLLRAGAADLDEALASFAAANPVMYLQELVDIPGRDLGVVFVGGRYLGTYARVRAAGTWNTSTRAGGRYAAAEPSPAIIELARRAQAHFNLDFTCVDVVETPAGPKVFEVSAFGGFRGLLEACSIDAAAAYTKHAIAVLRAEGTHA